MSTARRSFETGERLASPPGLATDENRLLKLQIYTFFAVFFKLFENF